MSYVLLGIGKNKNGAYVARIIVDKNTNAVSEISSYGLYAIKAKKEGAIFTLKSDEGVEGTPSVPYLGSAISIADFLEFVKGINIANSVFSQDVLKALGIERGRNDFGDDLRFSLPLDTTDSVRTAPHAKFNPTRLDKWKTRTLQAKIDFVDEMAGVLSEDVPRDSDGNVSRARVRLLAMQNAKSKMNPHNTEKETFVYVKDIGKNVRVNRDGLEHGLAHSEDTALATTKIGDLLETSICVTKSFLLLISISSPHLLHLMFCFS